MGTSTVAIKIEPVREAPEGLEELAAAWLARQRTRQQSSARNMAE
jgi:hypothetical protein